jgi:hypothetical protein
MVHETQKPAGRAAQVEWPGSRPRPWSRKASQASRRRSGSASPPPAGTPRPVIDRLKAEANRWLRTAPIRERMDSFSHAAMGGVPEAFAEFAAWDQRVWAAVVQETGMRG